MTHGDNRKIFLIKETESLLLIVILSSFRRGEGFVRSRCGQVGPLQPVSGSCVDAR